MNNLQQKPAQLDSLVNNQIDPISGFAINCRNCIHCEKDDLGSRYDICMKCGTYCAIVHRCPDVFVDLCKNYSAWTPRQKTILELISDQIRKMLSIN